MRSSLTSLRTISSSSTTRTVGYAYHAYQLIAQMQWQPKKGLQRWMTLRGSAPAWIIT